MSIRNRVKILRASAGSGKTYRLSFEYIRDVVIDPNKYNSILAVTFTNKATDEMKRRILDQLFKVSRGQSDYIHQLIVQTGLSREQIMRNANEALMYILQDYTRFSISTIDKFFQRVVRGFIVELGLDFSYEVELDRDAALSEAVDRLLEKSASNPDISRLLKRMTVNKLDEGSAWNVRNSLIFIGKELYEDGYVESFDDIDNIIQIFNDIKSRVDKKVKDFRDKCARVVKLIADAGLEPSDFKSKTRSFAYYFVRSANPRGAVTRYSDTFLKVSMDESECYKSDSPKKQEILGVLPELFPMIGEVVRMYDDLEPDMNTFHVLNDMFDTYLLLGHISDELHQLWTEKGKVPLHYTNKLISKVVGTSEPPFIYEKMGNKYSKYMIDEFQDTSIGQWLNFEPLLQEAAARADDQAVMLIGDIKQAIYRWRGGDWSLLARVAASRFDANDVDSQESLSTNWRSLPEVIDFNNKVIRRVAEIDSDIMLQEFGAEYAKNIEVAYEQMEQEIPQSKIDSSKYKGYVRVESYSMDAVKSGSSSESCSGSDLISKARSSSFDEEESDDDIDISKIQVVEKYLLGWVADIMSRDYSPSDIVVLVRNNNEGKAVASMLLGGGYDVVSNEALKLKESGVVCLLVSMFRLVLRPDDVVNAVIVNRCLGYEGVKKELDAAIKNLIGRMSVLSPIDALELMVRELELDQESKLDGQVAYIQAFYQHVYDYCSSNLADLEGFMNWWDEKSDKLSIPMPDASDAISIMTIHKSKGLEFACVLLPFLNWRLLPKSSGSDMVTTMWVKSDVEPFDRLPELPVKYSRRMINSHFHDQYMLESMYSHIDAVNLLYVALTRARCELYMLYEQSKQGSGSAKKKSKEEKSLPSTIAGLLELALGAQELLEFGVAENVGAQHGESSSVGSDMAIRICDFPQTARRGKIISKPIDMPSDSHGNDVQSMRLYGILLHSILERVKTLDDVDEELDMMYKKGEVDSPQMQSLSSLVKMMKQNSMVEDWFSSKWQVMNERSILAPGGLGYRPDRVMIDMDGRRAVVVDYKFGRIKSKSHVSQVVKYCNLLGSMSGYDNLDIRGYVWYVESGEIMTVI